MSKQSLVVLISDTHFGKEIEPPLEPFNSIEAGRRIASIPGRIIIDPTINMDLVDEIVVCLVGDIVEGEEIFPTQESEIRECIPDQLKLALGSIWAMLLNVREAFPDTRLRVETIPGNHGRAGFRVNPKTNWDWILYWLLEERVGSRGDPAFTMKATNGLFNIVNVKKTRGLLHHKGVKHTGTSAMQMKVLAWCYKFNCDWVAHGHWHFARHGPVMDRHVFQNGSLCGPDEWGADKGFLDPARQLYFQVDGDKIVNVGWFEW